MKAASSGQHWRSCPSFGRFLPIWTRFPAHFFRYAPVPTAYKMRNRALFKEIKHTTSLPLNHLLKNSAASRFSRTCNLPNTFYAAIMNINTSENKCCCEHTRTMVGKAVISLNLCPLPITLKPCPHPIENRNMTVFGRLGRGCSDWAMHRLNWKPPCWFTDLFPDFDVFNDMLDIADAAVVAKTAKASSVAVFVPISNLSTDSDDIGNYTSRSPIRRCTSSASNCQMHKPFRHEKAYSRQPCRPAGKMGHGGWAKLSIILPLSANKKNVQKWYVIF